MYVRIRASGAYDFVFPKQRAKSHGHYSGYGGGGGGVDASFSEQGQPERGEEPVRRFLQL